MEFQTTADATAEHVQAKADFGECLIRFDDDTVKRLAAKLGYAPGADLPYVHRFWHEVMTKASEGMTPAGPEITVGYGAAEKMRRALNLPLNDRTPGQELVRRIVEKVMGEPVKMTHAGEATAVAALSADARCVLALSADGSPRGSTDRQTELLHEQLGSGRVLTLSLAGDERDHRDRKPAEMALSGDRQYQLLREQTGDGIGQDDRQMKLLKQQLAGSR